MEKHDFHFLINKDMILDLCLIKELKNLSLSGKICFILSKIENISRFLFILNLDEESKVEYLKKKKNIHIFIKKKLFKKLKYYHGKFNSYSIALFVRMIIRVFIDMESKYGFTKSLKKISKISKRLEKINNINNIKLRIIQLYCFLGINYYEILRFELILVKLLL